MSEENQGQEDRDEKETVVELEETGDMAIPEMPLPETSAPRTATNSESTVEYPWVPEADHGSATRMLVSASATREEVDVEVERGRGALNFTLLLLMAVVVVGAFVTLQQTSGFYSEEGASLGGIIDLKEALARHQEQEFTYEEVKKQKRFGTLTIGASPKGAMICTDKSTLSRINLDDASKANLKKCPNPNERGEQLLMLTTAPGKIEGIDTSHMLRLVAQREGFQDFPLFVGTHLWPINQGSDAQYARSFKMVPKVCNRWQTTDSQMGVLSFYSYMHCEGYRKGVKRKKLADRTTDGCRCNPEAIKKKKKKKSRK